MPLPTLSADLLLLHAPAVFEFRNRRDIYFPFLGTSGDVPITPLYEYFPVGFKSLQRYLRERGHSVEIVNLSSVFIRYPQLDLDDLLDALDVRVVGIDLHWMVHVQGSLAVAERIKQGRPDILTLFGGISSTYYAKELIRYPFIDMVMRGYDTLEPMHSLLDELKGARSFHTIPNLMWKDSAGARGKRLLVRAEHLQLRRGLVTHAGAPGLNDDAPHCRSLVDTERWLRLQLRLVRGIPRGVPPDLLQETSHGTEAARRDTVRVRDVEVARARGDLSLLSVGSYNESNRACTTFSTRWRALT